MDEQTRFKTPVKTQLDKSTSQKLLEIPHSPFLEKLGYGTGVTVWKLQQSPRSSQVHSPWAVKNIKRNVNKQLGLKYESLINKEANILKTLNHENIVGFRGFLKSVDGRNCLAMENGGESLGCLIEERLENDLGPYPASLILKVGLSVAKALKYLHDEKRLLHGDVKPYNIVVKNDYNDIKLCDFGVSFSLDDKEISDKFVGTPIYSAPECQEGTNGVVTCKSDIFSFGLVLWEMISLFPPHVEDLFNENCHESFPTGSSIDSENSGLADYSEILEKKYGTRPSLPSVKLGPEYTPVLEIFYCCTEQDPDKRPTAATIVEYLNILNKS